jgi:hypothetical protein
MTDPFPTESSQRPRVFRTGGGVILVGFWLLLIGLGLASAAVAMVVLGGAEIPFVVRVGLLVVATLPLAVAGLGGLMMFGGERITIDPRARRVEIARGLWWIWERETKPLDAFHAVHVIRQISTSNDPEGGRNTSTSYPVRLLAAEDEVELAAPGGYQRARQLAEEVARLTALPLHDATEREAVVREVAELDESLAERARRLGERVRWPGEPPDGRVRVTTFGEETTIELPAAWRGRLWEGVFTVAGLMGIYAFGLFGLGFFVRSILLGFGVQADEGFWPAVVWAVPAAPVLYVFLLGVTFLTVRESVVVSPRVLKRVWRLPVGRFTKRIPIGEIEDLVSDRDQVILRTDRTSCRVGFALDKRGRKWLRGAVHYLLVNGPRQM